MSQMVEFETYLAAIRTAGTALVTAARRAGLGRPVPTCPAWQVRELLIHQGIIHRWAESIAAGRTTLDDDALDESQVAATIADAALPGWLDAGVTTLLATLSSVSPNVRVPTFLANPPRPREFWARRQAHETTVHAVDALSAELDRVPSAGEAVAALSLSPELAADGIDEILRGFFSRGRRSKLFEGIEQMFEVAPTDVDERWIVHVDSSGLRVVDPGHPVHEDAVFSGTAAQLYLGLWNRGEEITVSGDAELLDLWHSRQRVTWH